MFTELARDACARIAALETELLTTRLRRRGVTLTVAPEVVALLAERGFDPVFGARALRRTVRELLAVPVAMEVVRVRPHGGGPVQVTATRHGDTVHAETPEAPLR